MTSALELHYSTDRDGMANAKLEWLIVVQFLLVECVHSHPTTLPGQKAQKEDPKQEQHLATSGSPMQAGFLSEATTGAPGPDGDSAVEEIADEATLHLVKQITAMLGERIQPIVLKGSASCEELLAAATPHNPASALFPRELLGLSLVPVLVATSCSREAQTLVLQLFELLGQEDTEELLLDVGRILERSSRPKATNSLGEKWAEPHLQAVMFNIQQLARTEEDSEWKSSIGKSEVDGSSECQGWTKVNGTLLLGQEAEEEEEMAAAVRTCETLGHKCAGISPGDTTGLYRAVLRRQSRVVPSVGLESWIRECGPSQVGRTRRSTLQHCVDKREERVYSVMEWIPAVSTLYSLGSAVYYASVNCSATAKERAILSAVDLGTDALMAVTGGTVGVAGYALGAGVKTGVKAGIKYLLKNMNSEEDLIVNQNIWSTSITIE